MTGLNADLIATQDLVRDLLTNRPQLGAVSEASVTMTKTVRVSIHSRHTLHPAAVLLAWTGLLDTPTITGKRMDPLFTLVHVQGVHAGVKFTVTAEFGEDLVDELLRETGGELTVHDLRQLQDAGAR